MEKQQSNCHRDYLSALGLGQGEVMIDYYNSVRFANPHPTDVILCMRKRFL